jgi:hypothetical protein
VNARIAAVVVLVFAPTVATAQRAQSLRPASATIDAEFSGIISARELADGRVLVADVGERRVFLADFAKQAATAVGRVGQGPGEYQSPGTLYSLGHDSTLMVEQRFGRWHIFAGAELATTLPADDRIVTAFQRAVSGADGRGTLVRLVGAGLGGKDIPKTGPESMVILRALRASGRVDTIGMAKAAPTRINAQTNARGEITQIAIVTPPFAAGDAVSLFEDGWLAIVRVQPYRVDWRAPDGRVTNGTPLPWRSPRVTDRELEAFFRARARPSAGTSAADGEQAIRRQVDEARAIAPTLVSPVASGGAYVPGGPSGTGVVQLPDGRLLIRHPETPDRPTPLYDIVDRGGRLAGTLALGAGQWIVATGRGGAYVVTTDGDGIQTLSRHPWP